MALIFLNPSDPKNVYFGHLMIDAATFARESLHHILAPVLSVFQFLYYHIYVYLPRWLEYRKLTFEHTICWIHLSWQWWLIWICGYWYEPPPGKRKYNGTYWHHEVYEPIFQLRSQFRDLARKQRRLDRQLYYTSEYSIELAQMGYFMSMMALYFVGIIYFVGRILFFRIGWLRDCAHSKRMWYKHRKLKQFRVQATALNIDKRL